MIFTSKTFWRLKWLAGLGRRSSLTHQRLDSRVELLQGWLTHHASAVKASCIGRRSHRAVAGLPATISFSLAAFMLAGNIATRSAIREIPATLRNRGSSSPMAPAISHRPVKYTIAIAFPNARGTMRAMLYLAFVKCATPVNKNIAASAQRADATQVANATTPSAPATRKISSPPTSTTITITMKIVSAFQRNLQVIAF
jgi:hypothetical protein